MEAEIAVAKLLGPAAADGDLNLFLPAGLNEAGGDQQKPSSTAFGLGVLLGHDKAHE